MIRCLRGPCSYLLFHVFLHICFATWGLATVVNIMRANDSPSTLQATVSAILALVPPSLVVAVDIKWPQCRPVTIFGYAYIGPWWLFIMGVILLEVVTGPPALWLVMLELCMVAEIVVAYSRARRCAVPSCSSLLCLWHAVRCRSRSRSPRVGSRDHDQGDAEVASAHMEDLEDPVLADTESPWERRGWLVMLRARDHGSLSWISGPDDELRGVVGEIVDIGEPGLFENIVCYL